MKWPHPSHSVDQFKVEGPAGEPVDWLVYCRICQNIGWENLSDQCQVPGPKRTAAIASPQTPGHPTVHRTSSGSPPALPEPHPHDLPPEADPHR